MSPKNRNRSSHDIYNYVAADDIPDDMSKEELYKHLEASGIDAKSTVSNISKKIEKSIALQKLANARKKRTKVIELNSAREKRLDNISDQSLHDEFENNAVGFRKFENLEDDDKEAILDAKRKLDSMSDNNEQ